MLASYTHKSWHCRSASWATYGISRVVAEGLELVDGLVAGSGEVAVLALDDLLGL